MKKYFDFGGFPTLVALAMAFSLPLLALPVMAVGQTYVSVSSSAAVSGSNSSQTCSNFTYNLNVGARDNFTGGQVSALQRFLASQGVYSGPVTGYFGPLTFSSVVRFQRAHGISGVGSVGPLTRAALRSAGCVVPPILPPPPNSVAPVITSLNPASGQVGSLVTVYGSRFTADNTIHFNGGVVPHAISNDGSILTFRVPQALDPACYFAIPRCMTFAASQLVTPGNYSVSIENINGTSNSLTFTVVGSNQTKVPQITSISPSSGQVGTTFTIYGSGFTSDNNVKFDIGGASHVAAGNNGTTLTFTVPGYVSPTCPFSNMSCAVIAIAKRIDPGVYNVYVENSNGLSNMAQFNVTTGSSNVNAPTISSVSGPTSLQPGQTGTWSITARDGSYGQLTYDITWGDESLNAGVAMSAPRFISPQQTTTFTHAYSNTGTYTITFTVTNNVGLSAKSTMTVAVYPPIQY